MADIKLTHLKWGPFPLTGETIDSLLFLESPGTYALGRMTKKGVLEIEYVGRADKNVNKSLKEYVGHYTHFAVTKHASVHAAHEHECQLYHDFGPPDNRAHPRAPEGVDTSCPHCSAEASP